MSKLREAAQAALGMFEHMEGRPHVRGKDDCYEDIIEEIRAALAEQEPEPVAWQYVWGPGMYYTTDSRGTIDDYAQGAEDRLPPGKRGYVRPLYTTPPRREWQGLTDEEVERLTEKTFWPDEFARAIEAKLKEKNHGI